MKKRTFVAIAFIALLCLLGRFGHGIIELRYPGDAGAPNSGSTKLDSPAKSHHLRDQWLADARTAVAVIHYLLEKEPPNLNKGLIASNVTRGNFPDALPGGASRRVMSNTFASIGDPLDSRLLNGTPFTNQLLIASFGTLPSGLVSSLPFGDVRAGTHIPSSSQATQLNERYRIGTGHSLGFEGLESFNIFNFANAVATNSQNASNAPSRDYKPGLTDSTQRPA